VDAGHRVGVGELPRREILARLGVLVVVVGGGWVVSSVLEDATADLVAGDADLAHCGSSSRPATHGIVNVWERTIAVKRQEVRQWSGLARYETSRGARRVGD
jgi:hypothetical protein